MNTTPSQTVGPFFGFALPWDDGPWAVSPGTAGMVTIAGTVFDGAGNPVPDALIETWQADPDGRFDHPDDPRGARTGSQRWFARCPTDTAGGFAIHTVKPGALPTGDGRTEAPHLDVTVLARGLLRHLVTRIYFPDEAEANAADPVLSGIEADRRSTLIARTGQEGLRFDIRLRGPDETVFFAV